MFSHWIKTTNNYPHSLLEAWGTLQLLSIPQHINKKTQVSLGAGVEVSEKEKKKKA